MFYNYKYIVYNIGAVRPIGSSGFSIEKTEKTRSIKGMSDDVAASVIPAGCFGFLQGLQAVARLSLTMPQSAQRSPFSLAQFRRL